jgi:hypothetical protein
MLQALLLMLDISKAKKQTDLFAEVNTCLKATPFLNHYDNSMFRYFTDCILIIFTIIHVLRKSDSMDYAAMEKVKICRNLIV